MIHDGALVKVEVKDGEVVSITIVTDHAEATHIARDCWAIHGESFGCEFELIDRELGK